MADPSTYRPATKDIPTAPGVYRFRDEDGRVIYVGKAKSLRARLTSYFQNIAQLHPRTAAMVTTAGSVEWTVVANEIEALTLEYTWIKEFDPRYNVMFKDDKSYPYLAVTLSEKFPRAMVTRGKKRAGNKYFGPYTQVWAIRETLDQLLRVFPVRTCTPGVFKQAVASGRPCLLGYIDKCAAPCVGWISEDDHRDLAEELSDFMAGRTGRFLRDIEDQMRQAAESQDYEKAARLRDDLQALQNVLEKNAVVLPDNTDADVFALASDELQAAVQVFHVRGGRVRGQRGWVVERVEDIDDAGLLGHLLTSVYGVVDEADIGAAEARGADTDSGIPRSILLQQLPDDIADIQQWLTKLRGTKVDIRVPQRGAKVSLLQTVHTNAEQALVLHKSKRAGDLTARSAALNELTEALGLATSPLRIETIDVSHTQGVEQVASLVVFEDGIPRKTDYRHFIVRGPDGDGAADDTAAIDEVLRRRLARIDEDRAPLTSGAIDPDTGKTKRFAYPPQLLVIDGGAPQVNTAARVLADLDLDIPVIGLAKRLEEVWMPHDPFPVILPRTSNALYLLQHMRDESHRFALRHHRKRRSGAMTRSALDAVPGVGPSKQLALLRQFGSLAKIRAASVDELATVSGVGPALANTIHTALNPQDPDTQSNGSAQEGAARN